MSALNFAMKRPTAASYVRWATYGRSPSQKSNGPSGGRRKSAYSAGRDHWGNFSVTWSVVGSVFHAVLRHVTHPWELCMVTLWRSTAATVAGRAGQMSCTALSSSNARSCVPSCWQLAVACAACTADHASSSGKQVMMLLRLVGLAFSTPRTSRSWKLVSGRPRPANS